MSAHVILLNCSAVWAARTIGTDNALGMAQKVPKCILFLSPKENVSWQIEIHELVFASMEVKSGTLIADMDIIMPHLQLFQDPENFHLLEK